MRGGWEGKVREERADLGAAEAEGTGPQGEDTHPNAVQSEPLRKGRKRGECPGEMGRQEGASAGKKE